MNKKQISSTNKEGFLQKLHLLQIRGCLKRHRFSPNIKLFRKLPSRLVFPLKGLVGDTVLHAGHVFLGFTRDGHFLLSYTLQVEADVNTAMPCYTYQLHWWHFMPYRPLKKMSEIRLFGENEINQDLRIVVCQWPMDEENILIYGCCSSSIQDSVQCYLTITAQPPLQQCSDCLITKEKQSLNEIGEASYNSRCLKHSFIVHTNFLLVPPYPSFNPSICMKKDKMVIINTGDNILSLSVETPTVLSTSFKSDLTQLESGAHISSENSKEVFMRNSAENNGHHGMSEVGDKSTLTRLDSLNSSHSVCKSRENSSHIGSPLQCNLSENCLDSNSCYNFRSTETGHTVKKSECSFSTKVLKDDGITQHSSFVQPIQLEMPCERHIDNTSVPQIEENQLLNQHWKHRNIPECNKETQYITTIHSYDPKGSMSSKLTYSPSCGSFHSTPLAFSSNDRNKRLSVEEHDNGINEKRRKPSDIKQQKDANATHSAFYCEQNDLLNQSEHQHSEKPEFYKTASYPIAGIDEAIKENISPDPRKRCTCCEINNFSSDHCVEASARNRNEITFCSSHCCTLTSNKLTQAYYTRGCVSEAVRYFVQEDDSNYVREDSDDFWNSEYPTIFSLEVHGTAYKPLKMLKKSSLHCWQGQAVIIHQVVFDIELYIHEMGQRICKAAGVRYLAFNDYDVQIVDLCPVSSVVVILVLMLVQATVEKKDGDDALNLGRHTYQTGFQFEWNIATGVYCVTDTDELIEVDPHHRKNKRWNEIWNPAQQAAKHLQKLWLLPSSTIHSVNILTNEAVFQGKSLKVLWPASHHVAVVL